MPWEYAAAGTALIVGLVVGLAPAPAAKSTSMAPPSFAQVQSVVAQRCAMCHNDQVVSKGVQLHTPELIARNAQAIYQQAVVLKAMPMNNATQITDAERALLGRWFEAGAPTN